MKAYLDLDGVCYGWLVPICRHFGIDYSDPLIQAEFKDEYDGIEKFIGSEKINKYIEDEGYNFWINLPLLPWAKDLYSYLCSIAGEENVYFCTAFGKWTAGASAKADKLIRDFNSKRLVLIKDKYLLANANSILIDDKPENIKLFYENGGHTWIWPHEFELFSDPNRLESELKSLKEYIKKHLK